MTTNPSCRPRFPPHAPLCHCCPAKKVRWGLLVCLLQVWQIWSPHCKASMVLALPFRPFFSKQRCLLGPWWHARVAAVISASGTVWLSLTELACVTAPTGLGWHHSRFSVGGLTQVQSISYPDSPSSWSPRPHFTPPLSRTTSLPCPVHTSVYLGHPSE